jgi:hypothetical protein
MTLSAGTKRGRYGIRSKVCAGGIGEALPDNQRHVARLTLSKSWNSRENLTALSSRHRRVQQLQIKGRPPERRRNPSAANRCQQRIVDRHK